ncbi:caspase family protein [Pseudosulfitobacter koreensis]|uniref:Caspase family protein n=1 Tax=Pseudosulfitobacter koreensis TaxID=2968472 RepID=A0ABT1Z2H0_9RHOB|nr:caspase family protein [Pseudosulfitobacter koreense]MCR8827336.1 caspase family protein [Pseudosulfitobacter koreense]
MRGFWVLLIWVLVTTGALAETRLAFVVGNSAYTNVSPLDNPINDALDVSVALEGLGFDVILGSDANMEEMREGTAIFAERAATADVVLFYYAGHGFQVSGQNYLVPVDAALQSVEDLDGQTVPLTDVLAAMQNSDGLKLVFLDACRDNPFGVELRAESGLARVSTAADFMFVYATQPDNVAYDGTGRNSFFTEAVLSHIYTPGQDIQDLMISVRRDVLSATGGRQVPWENSSLTQSFRFDNSPVTASEETMLWQVAASERDPDLMQLYADRYPQGAHVDDVLAFLQTGTKTRTLGIRNAEAEAERLWQLARRSRMRPLLEYYLERYPDGADASEAQRLLALIPPQEDSTPGGVCERLATHPRDATAAQSGVPFERLQRNALTAIQACAAASAQFPQLPHYTALYARAVAASGDIERAVTLYKSAADRGDLRAMVSLAQLTETGNGLPQDPAAALALYQRAAEGGSPDAMINLAIILFEGQMLPRDEDRAIGLLRAAAKGGSPKAVFNLGVLAQDGVVDTPGDALTYFRRAADEGETEGYRAAAILLDEGRGVQKNPDEAANLLLRGVASDRGALLAQLTEASERWSGETIRAVQSRLKAAGFYAATVDGLPGPSFTAALNRWRDGGFNADVLVN